MSIREISSAGRSEGGRFEQPEYRFGSFELRSDGTLLRKSTVVTLPPKELAVLRCLLADQGKVVTIDELRRAGWGNTHVSPDSLPRCISSLRARLGSELSISTVYKRGYRFEVPADATIAVDEKSSIQNRNWRNAEGEIAEAWDDGGGNSQSTSNPIGLVARPLGLAKLVIFPFQCGNEVPEQLGSEIAEETVFRLSRATKAVVDLLASHPVFVLANRGLTALEAGVSLKADLVLAGKITATPTYFRLRAELFRVDNSIQLWVEDFLIPRGLVSMAELRMARLITTRIAGTFARNSAGRQSNPRSGTDPRSESSPAESPEWTGGEIDCLNHQLASAPLTA